MLQVRTFNTTQELLAHLEGRTAPCRTSSAPTTAADLVSPKDRAESDVNVGPVQTSGYAKASTLGVSGAQWNDMAASPAPTKAIAPPPPKSPTSLSTVVTVETPEKPKIKARNLGIGQAIRLFSGNTVYRLAPENYLVLTPYNVTLHHSSATLPDFEGELLPLGTKITIRV